MTFWIAFGIELWLISMCLIVAFFMGAGHVSEKYDCNCGQICARHKSCEVPRCNEGRR
jgi:hypothetical protein